MDDMKIGPVQGKGESQRSPAAAKAAGSTPPEPRRDFLTKAAAVVTGGAITACPIAAGVAVVADPLMRSTGEAKFVRVAASEAVPADGVPRQFPVIVESRDDAWTRYVNEAIGAVILRRDPETKKIVAWTATCPHAGCFVGFQPANNQFFCPCHNSAFGMDGKVLSGPPPRDLDSLEVEEQDDSIMVKFQDFIVGVHDKIVKT
jgi:menaquinol-cytochrome c reductase iron-sulfur subunit